jgi:hypothetical protein
MPPIAANARGVSTARCQGTVLGISAMGYGHAWWFILSSTIVVWRKVDQEVAKASPLQLYMQWVSLVECKRSILEDLNACASGIILNLAVNPTRTWMSNPPISPRANFLTWLKKSPRCVSSALGLWCPVCHPPVRSLQSRRLTPTR